MQTIYLDISNKGVVPIVYAKQNEVGRKFLAVLTDSGIPYAPPAGSVFSAWYDGDSGDGNYTDIGEKSAFVINGNKIEVELISQMISVPGEGVLCLVLNLANGSQIASWNIKYEVEPVPGADSEQAVSYYTAFSKAVENLPYPDTSLSVPGKAADAAAVGNEIKKITPAQIGAAPAGYGIGGNAKDISGQDLNTIVAGGFYYWNDTAINSPLGANCYMEVIPGSGHSLTQIVREMTSNIGCSMQRCKISWGTNEWTEWEWVNPPMHAGVEYRTTERYMGKAVYAVLVNFGALPNNASKNTETSISAKRIVSVNTWFVDGEIYSYSDSTLITFYRAAVSNGHIRLDISTNYDCSNTDGYFLVKYTKE